MCEKAQRVRVPRFHGIIYDEPDSYLFLDTSFASPANARALSARLGEPTSDGTLARISQFLRDELTCDNDLSKYGWRTVDRILGSGYYIGCADYAMVFGTLARACGIPTVWVKSMDLDWIHTYRTSRHFNGGRGHVFLELHVNHHWCLFDADTVTIWEDYRPGERLLPDERYAYDKGGNPYELILSHDWDRWRLQTMNHFSSFDLSVLDFASRAYGRPRMLGAV